MEKKELFFFFVGTRCSRVPGCIVGERQVFKEPDTLYLSVEVLGLFLIIKQICVSVCVCVCVCVSRSVAFDILLI